MAGGRDADRATSSPDERPDPVAIASRIDDRYEKFGSERETQFRAALTAVATYLTLMATAGLQAAEHADDSRVGRTVRTAQFFLTILALLVLRYSIGSVRGFSESIADNGARRHELERDYPTIDR